jgi:hypothetical protein
LLVWKKRLDNKPFFCYNTDIKEKEISNMTKCERLNCRYRYYINGDPTPQCGFPDAAPYLAPCEEEDYETPDWNEVDETGFDPYEGCYTYDC